MATHPDWRLHAAQAALQRKETLQFYDANPAQRIRCNDAWEVQVAFPTIPRWQDYIRNLCRYCQLPLEEKE